MNRPNFLIITSDQQHWNTIGAFNNEISTPNLDRLVKEGTTFTRAYCPNPTCTPTRASMITGMYPSQHGAWSLGTKLSENQHTVGEDLADSAYETALVGKAHFQPLQSTEEYPSLEAYPKLQDLDFWREFSGPFYGFDQVELTRNHTNESHVGQHYALWLEEKGLKNWRDYFLPPTGSMEKGVKRKWGIPEEYHYDAWIAERTNALLESYQESSSNFLLWASFFDPHPDYFVPSPWDTMYNPDFSPYRESGFGCHGFHSHVHDVDELKKDIATYYGMISLMDKYIGKILAKLDALGLSKNTVVIFTSDHGHFFGQHGLIAKGAFHYEDMIKVPLIVRYLGVVPSEKISNAMQSLVDIAPTILNLAGISVPRTMTGIDQSSVWRGEQGSAREHILCENHHEPTSIHLKTYVDQRYKITVYYNHTYGELYDLYEDPGEHHNLWNDDKYAELKSKLLLKYIWAELAKEPMWMPRISGA